MTSRSLVWLLPLSMLAAVAVACSDDAGEVAEITVARSSLARELAPSVSESELATFASDRADFSLDLLRKVTEQAPNANVVISPQSASVALAMTHAGSGAETKDAMAKALHFMQPEATIHSAFDATDLALAAREHTGSSGAVQLSNANSVWSVKRDVFEPAYLDALAKYYGAGVNLVDFAQPEAAARAINGWVSHKTQTRIPELLSTDDVRGATWVLVNAIYLKANWAHRFTKESTYDAPFHTASGATVTVPTMVQTVGLRAVHTADYDAVELPYDGGQLAMVLVAPTAGSLTSFVSTLDGRKLVTLPLEPQLVTLWMPKFDTRTHADLSKPLEDLGMPTKGVFPGGADTIDVIQEAWLAVDEAGTEAAAATAVVGLETSAPTDPPKPLEIHLDRPFLYAIIDKPTGAILFLGEQLDPSAK